MTLPDDLAMLRVCVRRRRHAALLGILSLILVSSVLLIGSRGTVHVPSDYDVTYDEEEAPRLLRHKDSQGLRSSLLTDRKPQGQEDYNPDQPGLYHRRVIFNKANLPVIAKRLAFVHPNQYEPNVPEDDDDYAANDDIRATNDVIGDDSTEEEDEYEYWNNPNPVFKPGDFDKVKNATKRPLLFQDVKTVGLNKDVKVKSERQKGGVSVLNTSMPGSRVLHSQPSSHLSSLTPLRSSELKMDFNSNLTANRSIKTVAKDKLDSKSRQATYEQPATQLQMPMLRRQAAKVQSSHGYPVVRDHIFWSEQVEAFVPKGEHK